MRRECVVAAVMALLIGRAGFAQTPQTAPAQPPVPPSISTPPPDVFLATPETYAPHYDRPVPPPPPGGGVYGPWGPWPPGVWPTWSQQLPVIVNPTVVVTAPPESRPPAPTPSPQPPNPAPRAQPKTFYVIPGCYAGDKRPEPERLPRGCSVSQLRVIPPVVTRIHREP